MVHLPISIWGLAEKRPAPAPVEPPPRRPGRYYGGVAEPSESSQSDDPIESVAAAAIPPTANVLLVEDDLLQARSLAFIFRQEGYAVRVAATGVEALTRARVAPIPDLVVLDVALPDLSGVEVARRLRSGSTVPIIMLTARQGESDKIVGLDAGADDYVTKPFATGELLARVRSVLRRTATRPTARAARVYQIGPFRIDAEVRRLTRDRRVVPLSAREFAIVLALAQAEGSVVERRDLFASAWGPSFYGDERALDVYIRAIRRKIEVDPARPVYLQTVRGVGYRLADERAEGQETGA
jgi:DNA-binding response OmpR family regulator